MFNVSIYVDTSIRSPVVKDGEFSTSVEYVTKGGNTVAKTTFGTEEQTTFNRLTLLGIIESLNLLGKRCNITVYSNNRFIVGQYAKKALKDWERSEWITKKGTEVANKDLWQQFQAAGKDHNITIVYTDNYTIRKHSWRS